MAIILKETRGSVIAIDIRVKNFTETEKNMNTVLEVLIVFCILVNLVIAENLVNSENDRNELATAKKYKHRSGLWHFWSFHALEILFWIKVKVAVVAFFAGSAIVWAVRSFWHHKSCPEIVSSPPVMYDHNIHDHADYIHYSSYSQGMHDHNPYAAYTLHHDSPSNLIGIIKTYSHAKRKSGKSRQFNFAEDQISDIIFMFLGVQSTDCRTRFLCVLENKSRGHSLTRMAFQMFGYGFFSKYIRTSNEIESEPKYFSDCEKSYKECTEIEENMTNDDNAKQTISEKNLKLSEVEVSTSSSLNKHRRRLKSRRIKEPIFSPDSL